MLRLLMEKTVKSAAVVFFACCAFYPQVHAQVDAQWRGEKRDGIYNSGKLLAKWPEQGPAIALTIKDIGIGFSSPAVTKDRIYIAGLFGKEGCLFAYDHKGTLVWKTVYGPEWSRDYPGVRGTPTVEGDRVYIESGAGQVICLNAADGKQVWMVDMVASSLGGDVPKWGYNESVVIDGGRLICTPGGKEVTVAALDKATGKTVWTSKVEGTKAGYCSPVRITHDGREIIISMTSNAIIGLEPATGRLLWKYEQETMFGVNPNTPIYDNGNLICFSGYGKGTVMLKIAADGMSVSKVWTNGKLDNQMGGAVLLGGNLYASGHKNPEWQCIDAGTGVLKYSSKDASAGCIIAAGGMLYRYSDKGVVSLVQPAADRFNVISSFTVTQGSGAHWAHPVIAGGRLFVRHGEVLMVYNIAG